MKMFICIISSLFVLSFTYAIIHTPRPTATPIARALPSLVPVPTPTNSFDLLGPATPLAQPSHPHPHLGLMARCENPPCSYGGQAQTLSAETVTSTIMSTTSVPCYITTYITNSETITSTIYSTETITSTITEENTVYIIKYSPTPVVKSEVYETVIQITQTGTRMWIETEGEGWEETKTGDVKTVDGGSGGGDKGGGGDGGWKDAAAPAAAPAVAPAPAGKDDKGEWGPANGAVPAQSSAPASQGAWTHATAAAAVATPAAGVNAAGVAVAPSSVVTQGGWSTTGQGLTVAGQPAVGATWPNSAGPIRVITTWPLRALTTISIVLAAYCLM